MNFKKWDLVVDLNGKGLGGEEELKVTLRFLGEQPSADCTIW